MSHSYKKHPVYKWKERTGKKYAARAFRRYKGDIPVRTKQFYRRVYNSYNVWDNWWYDFDNKKDKIRFSQIIRELKNNMTSMHLSEKEAQDLLYELKCLKYCYSYIAK